jgi:hypothetical protein
MLCIACGLPSAGCLPSLGCPARATQVKPKRYATLWARARKAVWPRCPLGYSPLRGCALACALPYGFLALERRFLIFSQVLKAPEVMNIIIDQKVGGDDTLISAEHNMAVREKWKMLLNPFILRGE